MHTYIALVNWTDQGVQNNKETITRADSAIKLASELLDGGSLHLYWAMGPYDLVAIMKAPDEKNVTAFVLEVAAGGSVRTTTMRVYDRDEMLEIIGNLP